MQVSGETPVDSISIFLKHFNSMNKLKTNLKTLICFFLVVLSYLSKAQSKPDSLTHTMQKKASDSTIVEGKNGELFIYKKPKPLSFITQVPRTLALSTTMTFTKQNIPALAGVAVTSVLLISVDQHITNGVQQFGRSIHLDADRNYGRSFGFKLGGSNVTIYDVPKNINTGIYSIGEGLASVVLAGGLFTCGKINGDYRMIQTASQILQVQLAVGVITQTMKHISGRESPFLATAPGGVWRPLPGFSEYQNNTARYDAFPSGHLSTMMATFTVLTLNYPEKKWIKPVGIGLITLVGFAMINNGVHWAGDYPLALGIGYVTAKATVKLNRWVKHNK